MAQGRRGVACCNDVDVHRVREELLSKKVFVLDTVPPKFSPCALMHSKFRVLPCRQTLSAFGLLPGSVWPGRPDDQQHARSIHCNFQLNDNKHD